MLTDESYLASLSRSSALMLVEFYRVIQTVGVSSTTGLVSGTSFDTESVELLSWFLFYESDTEALSFKPLLVRVGSREVSHEALGTLLR